MLPYWHYPIWTLVNRERHERQGLPGSMHPLTGPGRRRYFPLFHDEQAARSLIASAKLTIVDAASVGTAAELYYLLSVVKRNGGLYVGVGTVFAEGTASGTILPIEDVLADLAKEM